MGNNVPVNMRITLVNLTFTLVNIISNKFKKEITYGTAKAKPNDVTAGTMSCGMRVLRLRPRRPSW